MKTITYIAPHKTAFTIASVMGIVAFIFFIPFTLIWGSLLTSNASIHIKDLGALLITQVGMSIFYFISAYLLVALTAWTYNKISRFTGGIRYKTQENI